MRRDHAAAHSTVLQLPRKRRERTAPIVPIDPDRAPEARTREPLLLLLVFALLGAVVLVARAQLFTPGSDLGYWSGVAGGVAMLLLFLYPLRKRLRIARNWGATRGWFALHMVLGITGPLLVILHSTLHFGSLNATVAFVTMALVASSGLVGRFLYARIHHGLYGERASLEALVVQLRERGKDAHAQLGFAPEIEQKLATYAQHAETAGREGLRHPLRFFLLGFQGWRMREAVMVGIEAALEPRARDEHWTRGAFKRRVRRRRALVTAYLRTAQRLAQLHVYQRLFSWWHVLHVPLVWMLVVTAIAHVIAVHMY
jgi:hypothetical protein